MENALSRYRDAFAGMLRGDAVALSKQRLSQTISFARISLIVGLVFLHYEQYPNSTASPFDGMDATHHQAATFANSFVLFFFFSVVPLLSAVSGWLFFSFDEQAAMGSLCRRIARRFSSLYLPLVAWNALILALLAMLWILDPGFALFRELNIHFESASLPDYANAVFGITQHPVGFQFWFVRDLFVSVLISPVLWLLMKRAPAVGAAALGIAWITGSNLGIFFRTDVVFFFYLGGLLRTRGVALEIGSRATWLLLAFYVGLVALRASVPLWLDLGGHRPALLTAATRAMRIVGVLTVWGVFLQVAATRLGSVVARYGGLAFFLHAAHYPLLGVVKILLWRLIPAPTDTWMIGHYLASVIVTVTVGLSVGLWLARKAPAAFALMNGGRAVARPAPIVERAHRPVAAALFTARSDAGRHRATHDARRDRTGRPLAR